MRGLIKFDGADRRLGSTPVGWETGYATHPANVNKIVLGARRMTDNKMFFFELGRIEIVKPYTDGEVRAMVMRRWGQQDPEVPAAIRLVAAQAAVESFR